jgi:hypothetical protein
MTDKEKLIKKPKPGQKVILTALPPGLIDDLPAEDQIAISEVVGKPITLVQYEEDGRAVLEFSDKQGDFHGLYVDPKFIAPC